MGVDKTRPKHKRAKNQKKRRRVRKRQPPKTPIDQVDHDKDHWCYLLYSDKHAEHYIGYTTDPERRLGEHRAAALRFTKAKRTMRWQDDKCRFLCIVKGFTNSRDSQQLEWWWKRYSKSTKKLCQVVHWALHYGKIRKTRGCKEPTKSQVLHKPWTQAAKPVDDPLRRQKGPFRVYWFPNLPKGFNTPRSSERVVHEFFDSF